VGLVHVGLNLLAGDPARLGDAVHFLEHDARPTVEGEDGNLGMTLSENAELGVAIVEFFWESGDAMRGALGVLGLIVREAARLAVATQAAEAFQVGTFVRAGRPHPGGGVRLTRFDTDPARVEDAIAAYEHTAVPWLTECDGFRSAMLYVDRCTGRSVGESMWRDTNALAASRSSAAVTRRDTLAASAGEIRAVEEYRLVFSSVSAALAPIRGYRGVPAASGAGPPGPGGKPPAPRPR
jgi:hypothetical protein